MGLSYHKDSFFSEILADNRLIGVRAWLARGYFIPGGASQRGGWSGSGVPCRTLSDLVSRPKVNPKSAQSRSAGLGRTRLFHPWGREPEGGWVGLRRSVSHVVRPGLSWTQVSHL